MELRRLQNRELQLQDDYPTLRLLRLGAGENKCQVEVSEKANVVTQRGLEFKSDDSRRLATESARCDNVTLRLNKTSASHKCRDLVVDLG